jgi:renalase
MRRLRAGNDLAEVVGEKLGLREVLLRRLPQEKERHHMTHKVAVIGAGMAGLSCASRLTELGHHVQVFEKSRGFGGRMSTRRTEAWECDHGAQYFTATDPDFRVAVDEWIQQGVAAPWSPRLRVIGGRPVPSEENSDANAERGANASAASSAAAAATERFVGTPRMTSPGQWLACALDAKTDTRVASIRSNPSGWALLDVEGTVIGGDFDAVVLAIPAPQIPPIVVHHPPAWMTAVQAVEMLPCWALMAEVDPSITATFDAAFVNVGPLSWIANNSSKPGRGKAPMWTIHASPQWTKAHLLDAPEKIVPVLLEAFSEHTGLRVVNATAHRWLYSLPATKTQIETELDCLWDPALGLGACGDWLLGGKVQGAWRSGKACAERIAAR